MRNLLCFKQLRIIDSTLPNTVNNYLHVFIRFNSVATLTMWMYTQTSIELHYVREIFNRKIIEILLLFRNSSS